MASTTFFLVFIPILGNILLAVNLIFAPHNPYQEKYSVFECGFHSFLGQNRIQFSISFFIFGLLFLLFDLEILLVFPYVVSAHINGIYGLVIMLIFFLALTLGFAFELGKNALKIDSRQMLTLNNNKTASVSYISGLNYQMLNLLSFFNSCDSPRSLGLYFINSATFQIEDIVELYDEIFGSTTMPPSVSPPSLTPEIGGIIILTLPIILILTDLLRRRRYNRRPDIMVIDLRIAFVPEGAFIFDLKDPSGENLTNLYKNTEDILWFPAEVPQRIYDYERIYSGMFVDLTSPLIATLRVLNPDLYEPILISQPFQGQSLGNIQFRVSIWAPSSSQWLFMQNEYGLILQTEDHIIPFSSCMPINLRLNFYGARGGLTDRQLLIRHNINPDLFL